MLSLGEMLCPRGDLNSPRHDIEIHRESSKALLSVNFTRRRLPSSIQRHPDAHAAGSREGSRTPLPAARSPP